MASRCARYRPQLQAHASGAGRLLRREWKPRSGRPSSCAGEVGSHDHSSGVPIVTKCTSLALARRPIVVIGRGVFEGDAIFPTDRARSYDNGREAQRAAVIRGCHGQERHHLQLPQRRRSRRSLRHSRIARRRCWTDRLRWRWVARHRPHGRGQVRRSRQEANRRLPMQVVSESWSFAIRGRQRGDGPFIAQAGNALVLLAWGRRGRLQPRWLARFYRDGVESRSRSSRMFPSIRPTRRKDESSSMQPRKPA